MMCVEPPVSAELGTAPPRGREALDRDTLTKVIDTIENVRLMLALHHAMGEVTLLRDMTPAITDVQREELHVMATALQPECVGPVAQIARALKTLQDAMARK